MPGQLLLTISISDDRCFDGYHAAGTSVAVKQPILSRLNSQIKLQAILG
jgi:hypothetical protein